MLAVYMCTIRAATTTNGNFVRNQLDSTPQAKGRAFTEVSNFIIYIMIILFIIIFFTNSIIELAPHKI